MTEQELSDLEDLALLTRYFEAHRRRGTEPHLDSVIRYNHLVARVRHLEGAAA
jgi:hypothetical protein